VIYVSEDELVVEKLIDLLRRHWSVWWARDIAHGDWERAVREAIKRSSAVLPVLSPSATVERTTVIKDEMAFAKRNGKPILPFLIDHAEVPLGFGGLDRTEAYGWAGEEGHSGYRQLKSKIAATIGGGRRDDGSLDRPSQVIIRNKTLVLPAFVFSLSSHETQVTPREGASLLEFLEPEAMLISGYDAWKYYQRDKAFRAIANRISDSRTVLFLDSGNYEAYRRNDQFAPKNNPGGWRRQHFWKLAGSLAPDVAFSFDAINPKGGPKQIVDSVVNRFRADERALRERDFLLCPIVHLAVEFEEEVADYAAQVVSSVAAALNPLLIAIPERELGDGLLQRVKTVRTIRRSLDKLDRYYPLHLLGTGNPLSMVALASAGADLFDGLEWCRTVADYDSGYLFHFQHFDCFREARLNRIQDQKVRSVVEDPKASYASQTLSYNVDYFRDMARTMQNLIRAGQSRLLLNMVPNVGTDLFRTISG